MTLRDRWRFRKLEERIENAVAEIEDAEDHLSDRKHWHQSFGGRNRQILDAERRLKKAKEKHVDLLKLQIERDSLT